MALKSSRRSAIPPFIVMDVMAAAADREGERKAVYHLEVGQPGSRAPRGVIETARRALEGDRLGYTVAFGVPELCSAIARHYRDYYGVSVDPSRVVVTIGSSGAFVLSFLAAFDVGDRVAMAAPGYPCYRNILSAFGIEPVLLLTQARHRFQPTLDLLDEAVSRTGMIDGLIVASPSNPAGTMLDNQSLSDLSAYCHSHGIRMISDEIYHGITYGTRASTALSFGNEACVINSFSKYYSMTGWRLGWMIVPEDLLRPIECLAQNLFISPPTLSQLAAVAAFDCVEELDLNVARYAINRVLLLEQLPKAGFERLSPADGAFYVYADVSDLTDDSVSFCARMLEETGVAITPGVDFDPVRGHRFVRFSFAESRETIAGAVSALIAWRGNRS